MKCEFCGANLTIENAFCPNCGKPNKYNEAHRQDMKEYEKRFKEAEEEVSRKTGIFSKRAVFITTIAVIVTLILAEVVVLIKMDDINRAIKKKSDIRQAQEYALRLKECEEERDIIGMVDCYSSISYAHSGPITEYLPICSAAQMYATIKQEIIKVATGADTYSTPYDMAHLFNNSLSGIYEYYEKSDKYSEESRYKNHMEFCEYIEKEAYSLISEYCDIPITTFDNFRQLSDVERVNIINESLEKVMGYEED